MTGGLEQSVLGAGHEVFLVLEQVELVGDGFLEVAAGVGSELY